MEVEVVKLLDKYKAWVALLVPLILTLGSTLSSWVITGDLSTDELRFALGGTISSFASAIAVYLAPAKRAQVRLPELKPHE